MGHEQLLAIFEHYHRSNTLEPPSPRPFLTPIRVPFSPSSSHHLSQKEAYTTREKSTSSSSQVTHRFRAKLLASQVKDHPLPPTPNRIKIRSLVPRQPTPAPVPAPTLPELDLALGQLEARERELKQDLLRDYKLNHF